MSELENEPTLPRSTESSGAALFESLGGALHRLLVRKFGIPPDTAESLVYELFINFHTVDPKPPDARAWLIAVAFTSARTYLQRNGVPNAGLEEENGREVVALLFQPEASEALTASARTALLMRFGERRTYSEIAEELDISSHAAERLVAKAYATLRGLRRRLTDD